MGLIKSAFRERVRAVREDLARARKIVKEINGELAREFRDEKYAGEISASLRDDGRSGAPALAPVCVDVVYRAGQEEHCWNIWITGGGNAIALYDDKKECLGSSISAGPVLDILAHKIVDVIPADSLRPALGEKLPEPVPASARPDFLP